MRVVACMGLLALCLALSGCSSLGKKTAAPKAGPDERSAPAGRRDNPPPAAPPAAPAGEVSGVVTGRVLDYFDRTPPADVWIVPPADGNGAPIAQHVETPQDGYFTFDHLRPGQTYRLVAVTKEGDVKQGGEMTVRAPATRGVIIQVSQNRLPAIPGGADTGSRPTIGQPVPIPPAGIPYPDQGPSAVIGQPVPIPPTGPASGSTTPIQPEHFAGPNRGGSRESPAANLPNPFGPRVVPPPPAPPPPPPPASPSGGLVPLSGPPRSPVGVAPMVSCDLRGKQLSNFTLAGLDGQPWEYKRSRLPGTRLMLLDFWGSWCVPCRLTIKQHLNDLNEVYGRLGLEVVGIAYEQEPTYAAQVRTVETSVHDLGIKYRILMGYGNNCPVRRDFAVNAFPTLVLINDKGQIIWRKDGMPTAPEIEYLKAEIRKELGIR
ncbi:MAG TPA: redoxin family protein [Gemmataceae bacterium]|nr:redoxin family protein [Gemmataceae bacterium]